MVALLSIEGLSKSYGEKPALRQVELTIDEGEIVALLGRNGAGKSTLVSTVAGVLSADSGVVLVEGSDVHAGKVGLGVVGVAPQETAVQMASSVSENLRFYAALGGVSRRERPGRIEWALDRFGLVELADRSAQKMSGGERRRLHTAAAAISRPKLLLLDEPTVGADIETRSRLLDVVRDLAAEGTAILYTTHYLPEVRELGARVAILDDGVVVADCPLQELLEKHSVEALVLEFDGPAPTLSLDGCRQRLDGNRCIIEGDNVVRMMTEAMAKIGEDSMLLKGIDIVGNDLDSVFLSLTGRRFDDTEDSER